MSALTAVVRADAKHLGDLLDACAASPAVSEILLLDPRGSATVPAGGAAAGKTRLLPADLHDGAGLARILAETRTSHLLLLLPGGAVHFGPRALERLLAVAADSGASWVYSDFRDEVEGQATDHPLLDYQPGSLRDGFDFGGLVVVAKAAAERAAGPGGELRWGALYDLRLKVSQQAPVVRVPEPLYARTPADLRPSGERGFDYVDPRQREYQLEMEAVATAHLKRIGAWLAPDFRALPPSPGGFPVRASVVIPVRNRERTVADAVGSALAQKAGFDFNVIVVDNHSTDGTTRILADLARQEPRLVHRVPARTDLGIGGCWNEAVFSAHCGEYAVQLDSDDLYAGEDALQRVVDQFGRGPYAMVIGAYRIVSFDLQEIPPGLIDHREWTRENGRNNALRINGLGAPRAFFVPVLRQTGLPNVSYGEDYATALRLSREYEIGRLYEPVYLARRWEGNSDSALPLLTANRYDTYKDHVRTVEILARQALVRAGAPSSS